jgi:hypothetical protein
MQISLAYRTKALKIATFSFIFGMKEIKVANMLFANRFMIFVKA